MSLVAETEAQGDGGPAKVARSQEGPPYKEVGERPAAGPHLPDGVSAERAACHLASGLSRLPGPEAQALRGQGTPRSRPRPTTGEAGTQPGSQVLLSWHPWAPPPGALRSVTHQPLPPWVRGQRLGVPLMSGQPRPCHLPCSLCPWGPGCGDGAGLSGRTP